MAISVGFWGHGASAAQNQPVSLGANSVNIAQADPQMAPPPADLAVAQLKQRAATGNIKAITLLAEMTLTGEEIAKDPSRAIQDLSLTAKSNDPRAGYLLYLALRDGIGTPRDRKKASTWLAWATERNEPDAQYDLGYRYAYGVERPVRMDAAIALFRKAAEQGHWRAAREVGKMYREGMGVEKSADKAGFWIRKADAGSAYAEKYSNRRQAGLIAAKEVTKDTLLSVPSQDQLLANLKKKLGKKGPNSLNLIDTVSNKAKPTKSTSKATGPSTYHVQIAAMSSHDAAMKEWKRIATLKPNLFANTEPTIVEAVSGGRTVYRIVVEIVASLSQARDTCKRLKSNAVDCAISRSAN